MTSTLYETIQRIVDFDISHFKEFIASRYNDALIRYKKCDGYTKIILSCNTRIHITKMSILYYREAAGWIIGRYGKCKIKISQDGIFSDDCNISALKKNGNDTFLLKFGSFISKIGAIEGAARMLPFKLIPIDASVNRLLAAEIVSRRDAVKLYRFGDKIVIGNCYLANRQLVANNTYTILLATPGEWIHIILGVGMSFKTKRTLLYSFSQQGNTTIKFTNSICDLPPIIINIKKQELKNLITSLRMTVVKYEITRTKTYQW
jgi:hypothetical protein